MATMMDRIRNAVNTVRFRTLLSTGGVVLADAALEPTTISAQTPSNINLSQLQQDINALQRRAIEFNDDMFPRSSYFNDFAATYPGIVKAAESVRGRKSLREYFAAPASAADLTNIAAQLAKPTQTTAAGQGNVVAEVGMGPKEAMEKFWEAIVVDVEGLTPEKAESTRKDAIVAALKQLKQDNPDVYKMLNDDAVARFKEANPTADVKAPYAKVKAAKYGPVVNYLYAASESDTAYEAVNTKVADIQKSFEAEQQSKAAEARLSQDNYNQMTYQQIASQAAYLRNLAKQKDPDHSRMKETVSAIGRSAVTTIASTLIGAGADALPDNSGAQRAADRVNEIMRGAHSIREYGFANTDVWVDYQNRLNAAKNHAERKQILNEMAENLEASATEFATQNNIPAGKQVELTKEAVKQAKLLYDARNGKGSTGAVQERQDKLHDLNPNVPLTDYIVSAEDLGQEASPSSLKNTNTFLAKEQQRARDNNKNNSGFRVT